MAVYFPENETPLKTHRCDEDDHLPDSAAYIKKLESRLVQLKKGKKNEPVSKEMLSIMQSVREDYMNNFIQLDERNGTTHSSFLPETEGIDKKIPASYIERKFFPEKNAVTVEELQHLLEADVLSKLHSNSVNESRIDR